jgi:predicted RNase H-like nuclease (RuvC/YqgF family)
VDSRIAELVAWREEDAETIANFARAEVEKDDRIKELERENEMLQRIANNADEVGRELREELAEARDEVAASKQRIQQLYASHERKDAEIAALMEDDQ